MLVGIFFYWILKDLVEVTRWDKVMDRVFTMSLTLSLLLQPYFHTAAFAVSKQWRAEGLLSGGGGRKQKKLPTGLIEDSLS